MLLYSEKERKVLEDVSGRLKNTYNNIKVLPANSVISNQTFFKLEMPPVIINNRVLIQARPFAESMGASVIWNSLDQTVTISREGVTIFIQIDQSTAYVNGVPIKLDSPPRLLMGRTVVPLRFIVENLGLSTTYDPKTETIEIY